MHGELEFHWNPVKLFYNWHLFQPLLLNFSNKEEEASEREVWGLAEEGSVGEVHEEQAQKTGCTRSQTFSVMLRRHLLSDVIHVQEIWILKASSGCSYIALIWKWNFFLIYFQLNHWLLRNLTKQVRVSSYWMKNLPQKYISQPWVLGL